MLLPETTANTNRVGLPATHRSCALPTLLAAVAIVLGGHSQAPQAIQAPQVGFGVCERDGEKLVGRRPVRVAGKIRAPKKLYNVFPTYPEFPAGTTGRGNWAGEALIDTKGNVVRVWAVREVKITPPMPQFNQAIVDAILQWRFEPFRVNNKAVPGCLTVTVNINWS